MRIRVVAVSNWHDYEYVTIARIIHWLGITYVRMKKDVAGYKNASELHLWFCNFEVRIDIWWGKQEGGSNAV